MLVKVKLDDPALAAAVRMLKAALASLSPDQQRIARKNSRAKVTRALNRVRDSVDLGFPAIRLDGKRVSVAGKSLKQIYNLQTHRLKRRGWRFYSADRDTLLCWAVAGVPCKTIVRSSTSGTGSIVKETWAPGWAIDIGPNASKLKTARTNPILRKRFVAEALLRRTGGNP
jgi:hypothetical protein